MNNKIAPDRTHIVKRKNGWAIVAEGSRRARMIFTTKDTAIKQAKKMKRPGGMIIIHKHDGTIQKWIRT